MLKKLSLLSLFTLTLLNATTQLKPIIKIGYDLGGTTLATVDDGDFYEQSIHKIRAGQGISFETGAVVDSPNLELQFLIGYKLDQESASNGEVTWDLIPFSAIAMVKSESWKFGGGVTYHLNPELVGSFSGYDHNGKYFHDRANDAYENAIGGVVQIEYRATKNLSIGLKGTFIEYKLKEDNTIIARGNSVGINFSYIFGERSQFR